MAEILQQRFHWKKQALFIKNTLGVLYQITKAIGRLKPSFCNCGIEGKRPTLKPV